MTIIGDGVADDTAALQAAVNDGSKQNGVRPVVLDLQGKTVRITSTILVHRGAVSFRGGGIGAQSDWPGNPGNDGTTILWDGPAGQPMFNIIDSSWCSWTDLALASKPGKTPSAALFFEGAASAQQGTNARHLIDRVKIGSTVWGSGTGTFDRGILVGGTNGNNDEYHITDTIISGATVGVDFINSQSIWSKISNVLLEKCFAGLRTSADMTADNLACNANIVDVVVESTASLTIHGWYSENAVRHAMLQSSGSKLQVRGGKLLFGPTWINGGANPSIEAAALGGWGQILLDGLWFSNATGTQEKIRVRGNNSSVPGSLVLRDCPELTPAVIDAAGVATTAGLNIRFDGFGVERRHRLIGNEIFYP